jgi:hypothetical protein
MWSKAIGAAAAPDNTATNAIAVVVTEESFMFTLPLEHLYG